MKVTIVIPALNEEENIESLISDLKEKDEQECLEEIIVVDGGSSDQTTALAKRAGAQVLVSEISRRSVQMNVGAKAASSDILYFLHADCRPPVGFLTMILDAIEAGKPAGCFRRTMHTRRNRGLAWIAFTSRLPGRIFRGGDASLYITRQLFEKIGGFDEQMIMMEDYEILKRLRPHTRFHVIPEFVRASSRKHKDNPSLRVFFANVLVYSMYLFGYSQESMLRTYRRMVAGTRY